MVDFDSLQDDSVTQAPVQKEPEKPLMFDDLKPDNQEPTKLKFDDLKDDSEKYTTPGQHALTSLEGVARGATAGLSDVLASGMRKGAEALGVPEEYMHYVAPEQKNIQARQEENPIESGASELVGSVGLLNKLPQMGSKAIDGMIKMGIISGGDEVSKALLGQGDPLPAAAAHVAGSSIVGLLTGGLIGKAEQVGIKALESLENKKLGSKLPSLLTGAGHSATFPNTRVVSLSESALLPEEIEKLDDTFFKKGQEIINSAVNEGVGTLAKWGSRIGSGLLGDYLGGPLGTGTGIAIEQVLENLLGKISPKLSQKYIGPAILKAASSGSVENLSQIVDHATKLNKGVKLISNGVENVFDASVNKAIDYSVSEKEREKLKEFIENGGVDQQVRDQSSEQAPSFAKGGEVGVPPLQENNEVAKHWPEQNILINATKARISNYLNSVRPVKNMAKLPYDSDHKDPQKDREYNKSLDLALKPLSILKHIKDGTLLPKHMTAFNSMYPDLKQHLSNKLMEKMADSHMSDKKKPSYKTRQALSLFLGSSLDSTLTPIGIQTAQAVFMNQKAMKSQPQTSTSSLKKIGQNAMTDDQARIQRMNKS